MLFLCMTVFDSHHWNLVGYIDIPTKAQSPQEMILIITLLSCLLQENQILE